jgi:hypothetical protein
LAANRINPRLCWIVWCVVGTPAFANEPGAVPYRPTVSTPAALSAPGYVELELGWQRISGGGLARYDSTPYTLKLAFTPDWGVRFGGDGVARAVDVDGSKVSGLADSAVVLKRRFPIDDAAAFGLEGGAKFSSGKRELGSGSTDYAMTGIYSADLGAYHTDLNVTATRLGSVDPGQGRMQLLWAGALSHALDEHWGIAGEFSGTRRSGTASTAQFLAAVSYNVSPRMVLDAGASRGLNAAAPDWSLFAGITIRLGKVF